MVCRPEYGPRIETRGKWRVKGVEAQKDAVEQAQIVVPSAEPGERVDQGRRRDG